MAEIKKLSPSLKKFFKTSYNEGIKQTILDGKEDYQSEKYKDPDILSIAEHLEKVLDSRKNELTGEDLAVFNCFMPALRNTIKNRRITMGATSFVSRLTDFMMYVVIWLNSEKGFHIDMKLFSRRKALEGELTKILTKSLEHVDSNDFIISTQPPVIRDRFGLRLILTEDNPKLLLKVTSIIISILTNPVSEAHLGFADWLNRVQGTFGGAEVPKELLLKILDYSFHLGHVKDYVNNPKVSTYQSWQGTISVDATSPDLGGFMFELQTRTWAMHVNAEIGPASHDKYKEENLRDVNGTFEIEDYSGGIVLYEGPQYPELDYDGLSNFAPILYRHVSPHVVKRTSSR